MSQIAPDPAAFARMLMSAQPRIHAYVRSLVYNPADADDILQEVAAAGWQKFGDYDKDRPFDVWMFGIARNQIRYYLQKKKRDILSFSEGTMRELEQTAAETARDADQYQEALEHCLTRLQDVDRDVVRMRYEPNATNRSVAKLLNVSESKISRTLNRIYAALMLCMKRYSGEGPAL